MKNFFIFMLISAPVLFAEINASFNCQKRAGDMNSSLKTCTFFSEDHLTKEIKSKTINILHVKGDLSKTAYYHGKYLAKEINQGVIPKVLSFKKDMLKELSRKERILFSTISQCVINNYRASVSYDFIKLHKEIYKGMKDAGYKTLTKDEFIEAGLAIELSIFFEGFLKKLYDKKAEAAFELATYCGLQVPFIALSGLAKKIQSTFKKLKFGCTGVAASSNHTSRGELILGRNFDSSLIGPFDELPFVLIHEPKDGYKYVGAATVGLHYAGGISGFNEKGITVSLHELQTEEYRLFHQNKKGITAPYLQNLILEKASSIDEAIEIVENHKHFGAWTIFIGDSKTDELASIEFTGDNFAVAKRVKGGARAQTNHFLAESMKASNFEYSFNKTLESEGRYNWVLNVLEESKGKIDVQWMIEKLAGHIDYYTGLKSFGRTATKAYANATHIMVPSSNELWMSLGETYPITNSTFVGLKINFDNDENFFNVIGFKRAKNDSYYHLKGWMYSLRMYVNALIAYEESSGSKTKLIESHNFLNRAIKHANKDNIFELPYYFIRGLVSFWRESAKNVS